MDHYVSDEYAVTGRGTAEFSYPLSIPVSHNRMGLAAASIPKSFYLVDANNRTFTYDGTEHTLPIGSYSATGLVSVLNGLTGFGTVNANYGKWFFLNGAESGGTTCNANLSKLCLVRTEQTPSISRTITFTNRLGRIMGWDVPVAPETSVSYTVTPRSAIPTDALIIADSTTGLSPNCVNFTFTNMLWVVTDAVWDPSFFQKFGGCLTSFFINDRPDQAYITYQNPDIQFRSKPLVTFQEGYAMMDMSAPRDSRMFHFRILDDSGAVVDLNGLHVDLKLRTWYEPPTYELLRRWSLATMEIAREQRLLLQAAAQKSS